MVIFHSYVSLPEGIVCISTLEDTLKTLFTHVFEHPPHTSGDFPLPCLIATMGI